MSESLGNNNDHAIDLSTSRRRRRAESNTSTGSQDVIIIESPLQAPNASLPRRRRRNRRNNHDVFVDLTCISNDEVLSTDIVDLTASHDLSRRAGSNRTKKQNLETTTAPTSTEAGGSQVNNSSPIVTLNCPVCLEQIHSILQSGGEIRSTICGHIFCKTCITTAIRTNKKCPTCRRKLTERNCHPLYLPIT